jgi:hypothetical protein
VTGTSANGRIAPGAAVAHAWFTYWRFS